MGTTGSSVRFPHAVRTDKKSFKIAPKNRQVRAKQEVGQLYFIIHNIIIYF